MRRVLFLLTNSEIGGGTRYVEQTLLHLDPACFQSFLASPPGLPDYFSTLPVHTDSSFHFRGWDSQSFMRLIHFIRNNHIDVVHSHGKGAGLYGRLAARACNIPSIHSFHGIHYKNFSRFKRFAYLLAEKKLSRLTRHFVCVSQAELHEGEKLGFFSKDRASVVPFGIKLPSKIVRHKQIKGLPLNSDDFIITMIARFDPVKRQEILVAAFQDLLKIIPGIRLIFVGDGPRRSVIENMALPYGKGRIHFLGTRSDIPTILQATDLVVLLSDHEGLPISLLEAMAHGLPTLATKVGGIPEIIDDGHDGFLIPAGPSPDFLVESVVKIWQGRDRFPTLAKATREKVQSQFSIHAMTDQLSRIYNNL